MNRTRLAIGFLVLVIALTACSYTVETSISTSPWQDITPPELIEVSLDLSEVDVSGEDREITVTARVTDDLSGVDLAEFHFVGPTKREEATATLGSVLFGLITDGEFVGNLTLPQYSEAGTWSLERVSVVDHVGNRRTYLLNELTSLGLSTFFEVARTSMDKTAPELVELAFDPPEVDTSIGVGEIIVRTRATDNLSGLLGPTLRFTSPTTGQTATVFVYYPGDIYRSVLASRSENILRLPRFSETGTWHIHEFRLYDRAGNFKTYGPDELTELGMPTSFEVTASGVDQAVMEGDVEAPEVVGVTLSRFHGFFPMSAEMARRMNIDIDVTDDLSGVKSVYVDLIHPITGREERILARGPVYGSITEGSYHAGLIARKPIGGIPQLEGNVVRVEVADYAGNIRTYGLAELRPLTGWAID